MTLKWKKKRSHVVWIDVGASESFHSLKNPLLTRFRVVKPTNEVISTSFREFFASSKFFLSFFFFSLSSGHWLISPGSRSPNNRHFLSFFFSRTRLLILITFFSIKPPLGFFVQHTTMNFVHLNWSLSLHREWVPKEVKRRVVTR